MLSLLLDLICNLGKVISCFGIWVNMFTLWTEFSSCEHKLLDQTFSHFFDWLLALLNCNLINVIISLHLSIKFQLLVNSYILLQKFRDWVTTMGACVSSPATPNKPLRIVKFKKKRRRHSKKHHLTSFTDGNRKRNSDAGARVSDISAGKFFRICKTYFN